MKEHVQWDDSSVETKAIDNKTWDVHSPLSRSFQLWHIGRKQNKFLKPFHSSIANYSDLQIKRKSSLQQCYPNHFKSKVQ